MEKRLSIALVLALTGCLVLADSTPSNDNITMTKNAVGKRYGVPYENSENLYGRGNSYGNPGGRPPYGPPQPYGNGPSYAPHTGPPSYKGGSVYGTSNNRYGNNNGYGNDFIAPQYDAYGNGPSAYGSYDQKQQYPASYPEQGPFYFQNKHHHYDTHYCSVHGSFSLAYSIESGSDNDKLKTQPNSYGVDQTDYGGKSGYGESNGYANGYGNNQIKRKTRFYTRQYCRYSAATSEKACNFCCRVVARSSNTSPDDIVSAIFAFDPINPTKNGAGFEVDEYSGHQSKNKNSDSSIFQCVCCAPRHSYK